MRELEVRLALVCFGGSSLAVYMNGVSHEILKLVRASKVYHGLTGAEKADPALSYETLAADRPYTCDTESIYFNLFRTLGKTVNLRVVVDVVSGASAGGINGIFLARALAYDLNFDPLRDMWLQLGDIEQLMESETLAERSSKLFMYPIIWMFGNRIWRGEKPSNEAKRKLSRFLRSRWFKPPFSGKKMLKWMIDANIKMGKSDALHSLMPVGHQLDLFVSLTNFHGGSHKVKLHDPQEVKERQHKMTLAFNHRRVASDITLSDFADTNIPGLGFAARATSSFPGAFPPVRLMDLKNHLKKSDLDWPHEAQFLAKNFSELQSENSDLEATSFIDGGVTNNKPFKEAMDAILHRPAHREVDRRIIFVDPTPDKKMVTDAEQVKLVPGFFRTILSALAEIPRAEPILDDLREIEAQNRSARRFEAVLKRIENDVIDLVDRIIILEPNTPISTAMLASWRERAHEQANKEAGYSYGSYVEFKAVQLLDRLATLVTKIENTQHTNNEEKADETILYGKLFEWAKKIKYVENDDPECRSTIPFLRAFDVDFRIRRLRFLLKHLNTNSKNETNPSKVQSFKQIKARIYESIAVYRDRWHAEFYQDILPGDNISTLMTKIAEKMDLENQDYKEDQLLSKAICSIEDATLQTTMFRAYVGFAFYDLLTLPMTARADLLENDEIRVDRISPLDDKGLDGSVSHNPLLGTRLFNFGAFFSQKARENDYILGRIHSANRLVDFILNAAGQSLLSKEEIIELRRNLVRSILKTEAKHSFHSENLIAKLRADYSL
jgi:patatin-related protein